MVANLYMEALEERAMSSSTLSPKLWLRYVDDTFVIWPHGQSSLEEFHAHQSIQFTKEQESECKLPFLDAMVERKEGSITTLSIANPHTQTGICTTHPTTMEDNYYY